MKKKGNISFVVLVALLVVCCGAVIINIASSSKYNSKTEYERMRNRYIAESGIDTAVGLFINYLDNQEYSLAYTKNEGNAYSVISEYSPYLLQELKENKGTEDVAIDLIANETKDYLVSIGFIDYKNNGNISLSVNTHWDSFKLSDLCTESDFILSEDTGEQRSKINPIFLSVTSSYNGGEVMCNVKISNIFAVRDAFSETDIGEIESVEAWLDISDAEIEYLNYQNYGGGMK